MVWSWRFYLAATLVGALAGLVGAAFHALLDQAEVGRDALKLALAAAPVPGWLLLMLLVALVLLTAMWLVRRFAPETAGSGVQEVEAILAGERQLHWRRVLPVKFIAGTLAVGSGLVLGREGPTIHMGAAIGQMTSERIASPPGANRALIAAGAAAGLAAAFNAPLASIVFVTEELREHFEYRFATIQAVILACCASVIVSGWMLGQGPDMAMPNLAMAPLESLPLFLLLGILIGALGVLFNRLLLGSVAAFRALAPAGAYIAAATSGLLLGALLWFAPHTVGGGERLVEGLMHVQPALLLLGALLAVRLLTSVGSYGLGFPGGIFAPMLALGTICGAAFAALVTLVAPTLALAQEAFAVAAMGALFAATVRAPLTGIILVIELTGAQALALPIILTCLAATFTAEGMRGRPIYAALLGLQQQPPPRAPVRRLLAAAMVLGALIAIERFDVGTWQAPVETLAEQETPLPTPLPTPRPTLADRIDADPPRIEPAAPSPVDAPPHDPAPMDEAAEPAPARAVVDAPLAAETTAEQAPPAAIAPALPAAQPPALPILPDEHLTAVDMPVAATPSEPAAETPAVVDDADPQPIAPVAAAPIAAVDPAAAEARFSIQLISFRNVRSQARFAADEGLLGQAFRLDTDTRDARWHPVLLGAYPDRAAAETALAELPARLQRLEPMIRPIATGERLVPLETQ